jgi:hypothetical protein
MTCALGVAFQLSPLKSSRIAFAPTMSMNGALVVKKTLSALIAASLGLTVMMSDSSSSGSVAHATQEVQSSIFVGKYQDPNHPEGSRVITAKVVLLCQVAANGSFPRSDLF